MSEFNEDVIEILRDFAESAADAALSMDNEGYQLAFARAVDEGARERHIKRLLNMSGEEQEEAFGEEILPEDTRLAIQDFQQTLRMSVGWS